VTKETIALMGYFPSALLRANHCDNNPDSVVVLPIRYADLLSTAELIPK
jgi:hypothetical protein